LGAILYLPLSKPAVSDSVKAFGKPAACVGASGKSTLQIAQVVITKLAATKKAI
jgi:hypothetical protein